MQSWSYATSPKWLLSHLFVATALVLFIIAGFWQLRRLDERQAQNEIIESRAYAPAMTVADAISGATPEDLDYVRIEDTGRWLDPALVRVANRSQNGLGGDWQIGTFETDDGVVVLVNRGFLVRDATPAEPDSNPMISGWLQISREQEGIFGAADTGVGERVPRLNVAALSERVGRDVAPVWLRLDGPAGTIPEPVPLPPINEGSHFSYAMQWFTFAILTAVFYVLILRKKSQAAH